MWCCYIPSIVFTKWKKVKSLSCVWLCDPLDSSLPGSYVHGIFQARVLEWVAISFSRGSSQPRNRTRASCIAGRRSIWATREALWFLEQISYFISVYKPNKWTSKLYLHMLGAWESLITSNKSKKLNRMKQKQLFLNP